MLFGGRAEAQTTYTWANSNVAGTPTSLLDWFTGGANPQGTWTGGDPVSDNANTIQFFEDTTTALTNTAVPSSQTVNLNNGGSAFELGTLTLSGLASATTNANLTMTLSGDALNFSALTGTLNLNALSPATNRTITYNVNNNIQLGTASSAGALTVGGAGTGTFVLGGIISELQSGGGSLIKTGTSAVSLTGANTYTGTTTLNGGRLNLNSATAIGTGPIVIGNGTTLGNTSGAAITLSTNNAQTWSGNFTFAGTNDLNLGTGAVSLGAATRTVTVSANTLTIGGEISGNAAVGLTKAGVGVLSLDAANTYTGVTTVGAGVLRLNNANALPGGVGASGGTSGLTFKGGVVGLTSDFFRGIGTSASQVQWSAGGGWAAFGADRTVNLGGNETPSTIVWGNTAANGGFSGHGLILGATAATHTVELLNGLDLGSAATRTVTVNKGTAAFDAKLSSTISGTSTLTKAGTGTLLITGNNTSYSGQTNISGVLAIDNANALGSGTVQLNNGGSLASTSPTPITIANSVRLTGGPRTNRTLGNAAATGNLVLSGGITITGGGSNLTNSAYLNLVGLSSVDVTGPVSATGAFTVAFNVGDGQTLRFGADNSGWTQDKNLTNSGTYIIGHPKALGGGAIWLGDNGTGRQNALIVSEVDLTGANALTNPFEIARISGGYSLLVGGGFGGTNSIELAGGVRFSSRPRGLTNYISGGSLLISGTVSGSKDGASPYLIGTGNTIISGDIVNGVSSSLPIRIQSTGITTFSGTNTYTGNTTVDAGTLVIRGTQAKASGTVTAAAAASIGLGVGGDNSYTSANVAALFGNTLSGFSMNAASGVAVDTTGGNFTVSDVLAGTRAFRKLGANTLTLSGSNTYAGGTTISGGTLKLGSGGSLASSPTIIVGDAGSNGAVFDLTEKASFSIGGSQTLTGKGTVLLGATTALTIDGLFSPGNSPGLFTYDGGSTTLAGTTLMEIWGTSRGADPGYDAVNVTNSGLLTLGGTLELNFDQNFADTDSFTLFDTLTSGSLAGGFTGITITGSNNDYVGLSFTQAGNVWTTGFNDNDQRLRLTQTASNVTLDVIAVPEPAGILLAGLGLVVATVVSTRRRSQG
jgi:fibronectin-binding autotransporter adhesin